MTLIRFLGSTPSLRYALEMSLKPVVTSAPLGRLRWKAFKRMVFRPNQVRPATIHSNIPPTQPRHLPFRYTVAVLQFRQHSCRKHIEKGNEKSEVLLLWETFASTHLANDSLKKFLSPPTTGEAKRHNIWRNAVLARIQFTATLKLRITARTCPHSA